MENEDPIALTRRWLERVVIGLNLCPFAKAVYARQQVRFVLSDATTPETLLEALVAELEWLRDADPQETDTTLLIHPQVLTDFLEYNDFLDVVDAAITDLELDGEIQVASFHPDYRFADSFEDAIENCTNRSPFPMLHLLREASVERAVDAFPDADAIVDRNMATLRRLGMEGWRRLLATSPGDPEQLITPSPR
jgi:hypothetical protein